MEGYFGGKHVRILQKDRIVESIYFDTKFEFELLQIHIYGLLLGFNWVSQTQVKDTKSSPIIGGHFLFYLNVFWQNSWNRWRYWIFDWFDDSKFGGFLTFHMDTKFKSLSGGGWEIEWLYLAIKKGLGPSPNSRAAKFSALDMALWVILQRCSILNPYSLERKRKNFTSLF